MQYLEFHLKFYLILAYLAVFMLGKGVIALFDFDSWIAVMELVNNQLRLLWQHLVGRY